MKLTDEQLELVEHPHRGGPCLCGAVAGAGKTTAICAACKRMIVLGVPPHDILVATFSKPGCDDMLKKAARFGVPSGVSWRTIHSCGWSILGELSHIPESRTPGRARRDPVLVDPRESGTSWWVRKLLREYLTSRGRGQSATTREQIRKMGATVFTEIGRASAALIWPDEWTAADGEVFPAYHEWATSREREPVAPLTADIVQGFYELWERVKVEPERHDYDPPKDRRPPRPLHPLTTHAARPARSLVRWFSYDDMIAWPARWIRAGAPFMAQFRGVFEWVVVDEAQDNNRAQTTLAEWLPRKSDNGLNLIFVGDDQQAIYEFRGSRPSLLRDFLADHNAVGIQFTSNFRSAQGILDVGNAILSHAEDRLFDGELQLGRTDPRAAHAFISAQEYDTAVDEAEGVLDAVADAIENGVSPQEVAVLYRLNAQSGPFELECARRGISYRVAGGGRFFRRPEIRTVLAFVRLALDEGDEDAWRRVCGSIIRGLGPAFRRAYPTLAATRSFSKGNSGWKRALRLLLPIVDEAARFVRRGEVGAAVNYLAEAGVRTHYRDEAAGEDDETDVDVALNGLAEVAGRMSASDLVRFATECSGGSKGGARVTLSTIHKAKGLEWEHVSAVGWTAGTFPFFKAPPDEERRLGYVCVTRAKQYLHVSWSAADGRGEPAGPSELVDESLVREHVTSGQPVWPGDACNDERDPDPGDGPSQAELDADTWGLPIGA